MRSLEAPVVLVVRLSGIALALWLLSKSLPPLFSVFSEAERAIRQVL